MATESQINDHKEALRSFIEKALSGKYPDTLTYDLTVNDATEDDATAFEVTVKNWTNDSQVIQIMQVNDESEIFIMRGEDFDEIAEEEFLMYLFLDLFLTYSEQ